MLTYRGRLAPSPTGYLHLGHGRTFWVAHQRARAAHGKLILRNEDLDFQRAKPAFVEAMYEDLRWLGLDWDEGPGVPPRSGKTGQPGGPGVPPQSGKTGQPGGPGVPPRSGKTGQPGGPGVGGAFGPYDQSQRRSFYLQAWHTLRDRGFIYPCSCSRKDLERALQAPHEEQEDDELSYPGTCRPRLEIAKDWPAPAGVSWRFKVPDGELVSFHDLYCGEQRYLAGKDFSDFLIWRRDDIPAYQLAVVVDDDAMQISEVVRGADLLKSTARQLLLFQALGAAPPRYFHCPLLRDDNNVRLAKRHDALSLRMLREQGVNPAALREKFAREIEWDKDV